MLFGAKPTSATIKQAMDILLAPKKGQNALVYINDFTLFLKLLEKHLQHVGEVLKVRSNVGMMIKLKEGSICSEANDYFGYNIAPSKLHVQTKTTKALDSL